MKAFEKKKRLRVGMAGGITFENSRKVRSHGLPYSRIGSQSFLENFTRKHRAEIVSPDFFREMIGKRIFQPVVFQNGGVRKAGERRFGAGELFRLRLKR